MILSHEHKFIFLRTKKTAGTSIELALFELCGPNDVITPSPGRMRRGAQVAGAPRAGGLKSPRLLKRVQIQSYEG
jgi:hypothetical protein